MTRIGRSMAVLFMALVLGIAALQPAQAAVEQGFGIQEYVGCTLNLVNNTHNCSGIVPVTLIQAPSGGRTALRINTSGFRTTRFDVYYSGTPTEWSVNIGDSASNDGWGGDAGTQSHDAEVQIANKSLAAYASDYGGSLPLFTASNAIQAGQQISFTVQNGAVSFAAPTFSNTVYSPNLFALAGQADATGPVNYDIYAAFNRTISGGRLGSGVGQVSVTLTR